MKIHISFVVCMMACFGPAGADTVELLDGSTLGGLVVSLTGDKLVFKSQTGENASRPVDEILRVDFAKAKDALLEKGQAIIQTHSGDILRGEKLRLADGKLGFTLPDLPKAQKEIQIESVKSILLPDKDETPAAISKKIAADTIYQAGSRDMLIVAGSDGKWKTPSGALLKITDSKIFFSYKKSERTIDRKTVRAIILAEPIQPPKKTTGLITTKGGSRYAFETVTADNKDLLIASPVFGKLRFLRKDVADLEFLSDRVVELSKLMPSEVKEQGFFDTTFSYKTDRSVGGGPIKLGGKIYQTGLGMHSYSRLTYDLDGKYDTFVAVVGIDDEVRPNGNAGLTILLDGIKKFGPVVLTGQNEPKEIRVEVTGAKKLTVEVDFRQKTLGAGDHVDIATPRLIKAK